MYVPKGDDLEWLEPEEENAHVEISVLDTRSGRFVPNLHVTVTLLDGDGRELGTNEQPYLWHPWLHHYGSNWKVPGEGSYTLKVHIDAPEFMRHDKENGRFFSRPVDVEFSDVRIQPGRE